MTVVVAVAGALAKIALWSTLAVVMNFIAADPVLARIVISLIVVAIAIGCLFHATNGFRTRPNFGEFLRSIRGTILIIIGLAVLLAMLLAYR